jgi:hypothetical protein
MMGLARLLDKHKLSHLPVCAVFAFQRNVNAQVLIARRKLETLPARASSLKDVDLIFSRPASNAIESSEECLRPTTRALFIEEAQRVVALLADTIHQIRRVFKFPERGGDHVFERVRLALTIYARTHFCFSQKTVSFLTNSLGPLDARWIHAEVPTSARC